MKLRLLFILIFMISTVVANATQYRVLPLQKQVEEADVFVSGTVSAIQSVEKNNKIWTQVTLTLQSALNFETPQIIYFLPGGSINGRSMKIETVEIPKLNQEQHLLLKKVKDEYFLSNLALGEYQKIQVNGEEVFTSKIFPEMPGLKNLKLSDFIKASGEKKWKELSFEVPTKLQQPLAVPNKERILPMVETRENIERRKSEANVFRIILWILGTAFVIGVFYNVKSRNSEESK